jgi:P-type Cu2+ transporter
VPEHAQGGHPQDGQARNGRASSVVLHVGGLHYASEKAVVERVLAARPRVLAVEANPVAQTATVEFDPAATSIEALRRWVEECGYHCTGRSVPGHVCDPLAEAEPLAPAHDHAALERADQADGHGHGGHAGMSMQAMVRDMRNRFLVALLFALPIALWSPLGDSLFGSTPPTPFGMPLWQFFLSLPVVFYSSSVFFKGAYKALKAKTLEGLRVRRTWRFLRSQGRDPLPSWGCTLTMEDWSGGYPAQEGRLVARFPCNSASSPASRTLSSKPPEPPRKACTCPQT